MIFHDIAISKPLKNKILVKLVSNKLINPLQEQNNLSFSSINTFPKIQITFTSVMDFELNSKVLSSQETTSICSGSLKEILG